MIEKKCFSLQSCYWMINCIGCGYTSYYLTNYGLTAGEVGMIVALFGIIAAILQPISGRLADQLVVFNWKNQILALIILSAVLMISINFFLDNKWMLTIIFGLFILCIHLLMPLLNSSCFYYENRGIAVNFGIARGFGSLFYAVMSFILGQATAGFGAGSIPFIALIMIGIFLIILLSLPLFKEDVQGQIVNNQETKKQKKGFLKRYPLFTFMLIGLILVQSYHSGTVTYLIQSIQVVGGSSRHLGTALAIAAISELPVLFGFTRLRKRFSIQKMLVFGSFMFIVKALLILTAKNVSMIYLAQAMQMLSFAIFASATVYYADEMMEEADKATGQAYVSCTVTIGAVAGSLIGGFVLDLAGVKVMQFVMLLIIILGTILIGFAATKKK